MDPEVWRWIWLGTAAFMALLEIVTAGFFILPFAIGAVAAFLLAWFGAAVGIQWLAFLVISVGALFALQRFVRREDEEQPALGANRFIGQRAIVLEEVDRAQGRGRVRMETEVWRATTEGSVIDRGTEVRVTGVVGSRLVVEPAGE